MKLVFSPPDNEDVENPDVGSLELVLMTAPPGYWESGTGDAALRLYEGDRLRAELLLMVRDGLGVFVQHIAAVDGIAHVLVASEDQEGNVTIEQGGDPWTLPRAFFVSKEWAAKAVREFCKDGDRSRELPWEKF